MRDGKQTTDRKMDDRPWRQWTVETQWDRLESLSDDAWKGVPKGFFPQAFQLQEYPRIVER